MDQETLHLWERIEDLEEKERRTDTDVDRSFSEQYLCTDQQIQQSEEQDIEYENNLHKYFLVGNNHLYSISVSDLVWCSIQIQSSGSRWMSRSIQIFVRSSSCWIAPWSWRCRGTLNHNSVWLDRERASRAATHPPKSLYRYSIQRWRQISRRKDSFEVPLVFREIWFDDRLERLVSRDRFLFLFLFSMNFSSSHADRERIFISFAIEQDVLWSNISLSNILADRDWTRTNLRRWSRNWRRAEVGGGRKTIERKSRVDWSRKRCKSVPSQSPRPRRWTTCVSTDEYLEQTADWHASLLNDFLRLRLECVEWMSALGKRSWSWTVRWCK